MERLKRRSFSLRYRDPRLFKLSGNLVMVGREKTLHLGVRNSLVEKLEL